MGRFDSSLRSGMVLLLLGIVQGCYLNASRTQTEASSPSLDSPPTEGPNTGGGALPNLKVNSLPTDLPAGYPYRGQATMENGVGGEVYSIVDSSCGSTLSMDSSTGIVSGELPLAESESCSYKVKVDYGSESQTSLPITVLASQMLTFGLSNTKLYLKKGAPHQTAELTLSSAAPFATYLNYRLYSNDNIFDQATLNNVTLGEKGLLFIPAGATSVNLDFEVTSSSTLSQVNYQTLKFDNGTMENKPSLDLFLKLNDALSFSKIATGSHHSCGISAGKLFCWGYNLNGQIGNGTSTNATTPVQVGLSTTWQAIAAGQSHSCGIDGGKLYCWGSDVQGKIGNGSGSSGDVTAPEQIGLSTTWQAIATGAEHTCGIDGGALYCWGRDNFGQIGNGSGSSASVTAPEQIGLSTTWQAIATGAEHTCGIDGGALYCWGRDFYGQVGNGSGSSASVTAPEQIGLSTTWQAIATGGTHTCGIDGGGLYCWGRDNYGQIGNGSGSSVNVTAPEQIGGSATWQAVVAGNSHSCGLDGGKLFCWGWDEFGQVGDGPEYVNVAAPVQIGTSTAWQAVAGGHYHTCGLDNGKVICWGYSHYGQVGLGGASNRNVEAPRPIGTSGAWGAVGARGAHSCAIADGKLFCWGSDIYGQIGNGSPATGGVATPELIGKLSGWETIAPGATHTCGINSGKLYCWGRDNYGQVGNGDSSSSNVTAPEQIGTFMSWQDVTAGDSHTCGINSGKLYCWGSDGSGQIGNGSGSSSNVTSPEQIGTSTTWQAIAAAQSHTCGIDDGKLYCWGSDGSGQIGNGSGSSANVTAPEQIGGVTSWTSISVGFYHTCGIESGNLYCWGSDGSGQIGNGSGSSANVTAPEQIGSSANWESVASGYQHTCGIDDGKLYCWGNDGSGRIGNGSGSSTNVTAPEQIGSSTSWQALGAGDAHTCGNDGGKLYCWGSESAGQVGSSFLAFDPTFLVDF